MSREHHTDIQRADGRSSEARYGPGGSATARRAQLAAQAASRGSSQAPRRAVPKRKPNGVARPILSAARQRWITAVLALTALLSLLGVFLASPLMRVRHVRLSGVAELLPEESTQTWAAAAVPARSNLFRLRTRTMQESLSHLPWVASASVARVFPSSLAVTIKPRTSRAHLRALGQDWEVDSSAVLIRRLRSGMSLPLVECAAVSELKPGQRVDTVGLAGALKVISECKPRGGVRIANVEVDQSGELCLNMSDNVAIRLGQEEALPTKIDYIQRIYDDKPGIGSEVSSIDLRWPESPSCVLRNASNRTSDSPQPSTSGRNVPTPRDPGKD